MSKQRYLIRCENSETLDEAQQDELVNSVYDIVDGAGIRGTFTVTGGWSWLDIEGESTQVQSVVDAIQDLDEIGEKADEITDESSDWTMDEGWYGHGDGDAYKECYG